MTDDRLASEVHALELTAAAIDRAVDQAVAKVETLTEENNDLVAQIAELRSHVRRCEEAIKAAAAVIHTAHGDHTWLRRVIVRVVLGAEWPLRCQECGSNSGHKMDCSRGRR